MINAEPKPDVQYTAWRRMRHDYNFSRVYTEHSQSSLEMRADLPIVVKHVADRVDHFAVGPSADYAALNPDKTPSREGHRRSV